MRPAKIRKLPVGEKVDNLHPACFDGNPNLVDPQHMINLPGNLAPDRNLDALFLNQRFPSWSYRMNGLRRQVFLM